MKIAFLDQCTLNLPESEFERFTRLSDSALFYPNTPKEETIIRSLDCDAVFTNKVVFDEEILNRCSKLKYIGILATGTNNVDLKAAEENGIVVKNAKGYSTASVAQHTMGFILNLATRFSTYSQCKDSWSNSQVFTGLRQPILELEGKTLGIIGYGTIGKAVERLAKAFSMEVMISESLSGQNSDSSQRHPLNQVLEKSDFISLHCPLANETKGLVNSEFLSKMKPTSYLINTSRGPVINEQDLHQALINNFIAGAAIDVLEEEPPSPTNPLLHSKHPNLLITPHVAWASTESQKRLLDITYKNFQAFLKDQ